VRDGDVATALVGEQPLGEQWNAAQPGTLPLMQACRDAGAADKGASMTTHANPTSTNPAKESLRKEQHEQRKAVDEHGADAELTKALEDTFPASDPVAAQAPTKPGATKQSH